jgi:predicted nucleic acid-binding protein
MEVPKKVYLDTNLLYGWFQNQLSKKRPESQIVRFLSEKCKDMEKFISVYTVAELLVNLKKDFSDRGLSKEKIGYMFEILRDTIDLKVIDQTKMTKSVIDFADLCDDHNDAVHLEIAKNENLVFVTRDCDLGRVKSAYPHVTSIGKLIKNVE